VKEVGPTFKERVSAKWEGFKMSLPSLRRPELPSFSGLKSSIVEKLPALPHCPNLREYLPEMPELPQIPLPEPLEKVHS
jgi:hypothetical protein